ARAQRVHQLHELQPLLALQQAALDQRAEHVGRLVQVVALAARVVEAGARPAQPAPPGPAVALLLPPLPPPALHPRPPPHSPSSCTPYQQLPYPRADPSTAAPRSIAHEPRRNFQPSPLKTWLMRRPRGRGRRAERSAAPW